MAGPEEKTAVCRRGYYLAMRCTSIVSAVTVAAAAVASAAPRARWRAVSLTVRRQHTLHGWARGEGVGLSEWLLPCEALYQHRCIVSVVTAAARVSAQLSTQK